MREEMAAEYEWSFDAFNNERPKLANQTGDKQ
jgi:hypothetical protein